MKTCQSLFIPSPADYPPQGRDLEAYADGAELQDEKIYNVKEESVW